jgi:MFS family permease
MLYVGNFLVVLGIMTLSLATNYWQVFLTQAVCMGLGAGLLYVPSLALIGIWFERKRALAMGIVMSGIAVGEYESSSLVYFDGYLEKMQDERCILIIFIGGVSYILMFNRLLRTSGFPWVHPPQPPS